MKDIKIDYAQLLETNNLIQQNADETYWLCATRTVQESKIFPVSAYILFSYLKAQQLLAGSGHPNSVKSPEVKVEIQVEATGKIARN